MTAVGAETRCTLRRLARRRSAAATLGAAALLLVYAGFVRPVASAPDALSAAAGIATLTLLVASAGIVAEDRDRGRLAVPATHPVPPASWVVGRWFAVWLVAGATLTLSAAVLLAVARGESDAAGFALAALAAVLHLAALGALAVALSCRVGATPQTLVLLALVVVGAVPPELVARCIPGVALAGVTRALWSLLPTSWALARLDAWLLSGGAPAPWLALALLVQPGLWLAVAARVLARAELPARGT